MSATILFLSSNPSSATRLELEEEGRSIQACLKQARYRDGLAFAWAPAARVEDFQEHLQRRPDLVHFSGHGAVSTPGRYGASASGSHGVGEIHPREVASDSAAVSPSKVAGALLLRDEHGVGVVVPREALTRLFKLLQGVRCVVLNACFTEMQAEELAHHVDYVIGTRAAVPDAAAINFSKGFYAAIGDGYSLEKAFELGCNAVDMAGHAAKDLYKAWSRKGAVPANVVLAKPRRWPWVAASVAVAAVIAGGAVHSWAFADRTIELTLVDDEDKPLPYATVEMDIGGRKQPRTSDAEAVVRFDSIPADRVGKQAKPVTLLKLDTGECASFRAGDLKIPLCKTPRSKPGYLDPVYVDATVDVDLRVELTGSDAAAGCSIRVDGVKSSCPDGCTQPCKITRQDLAREPRVAIRVARTYEPYKLHWTQNGRDVTVIETRCDVETCQHVLRLETSGPCTPRARLDAGVELCKETPKSP